MREQPRRITLGIVLCFRIRHTGLRYRVGLSRIEVECETQLIFELLGKAAVSKPAKDALE